MLEEIELKAEYPHAEFIQNLARKAKSKIIDELRRLGKLEHYNHNPEAFENNYFYDDFEKREQDKLDTEIILAQLPIKQVDVLKMHHSDGDTIEEIAEKIEKSPNTVKKRLKEAKKALRNLFGGEM